MTDWQLIETAPKDGTTILVCRAEDFENSLVLAYWSPDEYIHSIKTVFRKDRWVDQCTMKRGRWYSEERHGDPCPAYWVPIPDPPEGNDSACTRATGEHDGERAGTNEGDGEAKVLK